MRVSLKMLQSVQHRELTGMWWTSSAVFQQHTDAPRKQNSMNLHECLTGMHGFCLSQRDSTKHKHGVSSIRTECSQYGCGA